MRSIAFSYRHSAVFVEMLLVVSAISLFTPIIGIGIPCLIVGGSIALISLHHLGDRFYPHNIRLALYVFLYMALCVVYLLFGISTVSLGALVAHLFFFVCILCMILYPTYISEKQNKRLLCIIVGIIIFNIIDNIRLCVVYPQLFFAVNRNMNSDFNVNIGGSRFYNAILFFYIICLFGFLNSKKKIFKYYMLTGVIISAIFIFGFCLKASTLVFAILSTILLCFAQKAKSIRRLFFRIVVPSLIIYVIVNIYMDSIIDFLSSLFASDRLIERLVFLLDQDNASADSGASTMVARENLWFLSVSTWTDNLVNFVFGIGDHRIADWETQSPFAIGIGQHSDFFDSLARYGIIGMLILVAIFILAFEYILALFDNKQRVQLLIIFLIYILHLITKGGLYPDLGFLLFVFLPMLSNIIGHHEGTIVNKDLSSI